MLNSFESRLIDRLADGLVGVEVLVLRPQEDLSARLTAEAGRVLIVVQILAAETDARLGDDAQERLGQPGDYQQRPVVYLRGQVAVDLLIARNDEATNDASRTALLQVLDRVLLLLHASELRQGQGFQTGEDLGFALDGFRLEGVSLLPETAAEVFQQIRLSYNYSGRFWPVEAPIAGDLIEQLPTRLAIVPVQIPTGLITRAGDSDVEVPILLDLRSWEAAPQQLVARLRGAAPPGSLVGDTRDLPAGYFGYTANLAGDFVVVYRPPASLGSDTQVRIELGLSQPEQPSLALGELIIGVKSS